MQAKRRTILTALAAVSLTACATPPPSTREPNTMYGIIGKMNAKPGQRDALAAILLHATGNMPGCLNYIIANDAADPDALWITEV